MGYTTLKKDILGQKNFLNSSNSEEYCAVFLMSYTTIKHVKKIYILINGNKFLVSFITNKFHLTRFETELLEETSVVSAEYVFIILCCIINYLHLIAMHNA